MYRMICVRTRFKGFQAYLVSKCLLAPNILAGSYEYNDMSVEYFV